MSLMFRCETRLGGLILILAVLMAGCGRSPGPAVDTAPFQRAVEQYLEARNMALMIKEIKQGPVIEGDTAAMTASLTHSELGGAAVTWEFQFQRDPDGNWKAIGHQD